MQLEAATTRVNRSGAAQPTQSGGSRRGLQGLKATVHDAIRQRPRLPYAVHLRLQVARASPTVLDHSRGNECPVRAAQGARQGARDVHAARASGLSEPAGDHHPHRAVIASHRCITAFHKLMAAAAPRQPPPRRVSAASLQQEMYRESSRVSASRCPVRDHLAKRPQAAEIRQ